jgi:hypothetical protein
MLQSFAHWSSFFIQQLLTRHIPWNAHEQGGGESILGYDGPNFAWRTT